MSKLSASADELKVLYGITEADLVSTRNFGRIVMKRLDQYVEKFYSWLATQPEFAEHFSDTERFARVKGQQLEYWQEFFRAEVDDKYVERRAVVGMTHAQIGLTLQVYFAAMNKSFIIFLEDLYDHSLTDSEYTDAVCAVTKLMHLDIAVVVDRYSEIINQRITEQSRSLMEMSTPVTAIWEGILLLPVVGIIDSHRAQDMMNKMLKQISDARARAIILDIGGVAVVDTAVANHLIKITRATKLMGCECTISGISPAIAQTIVELGIDVGTIRTTATLRDAVSQAFDSAGLRLDHVSQA